MIGCSLFCFKWLGLLWAAAGIVTGTIRLEFASVRLELASVRPEFAWVRLELAAV